MHFLRPLVTLCLPLGALSAFASVELHFDTYGAYPLSHYASGVQPNLTTVSGGVGSSVLGASGSALGMVDAGSLHFTTAVNGNYGHTDGGGKFNDDIFFHGVSPDTFVRVRWTPTVAGSVVTTGTGAVQFQILFGGRGGNGGTWGSRYDLNQNAAFPAFDFAGWGATGPSFETLTKASELLTVSGQFDITSSTQFNFGGDAETDYGHSAHLFAQILTPGVTMTSLSGHNYSAVPEPSTFAPLGLGVLAFAFRRRARR